MSRAPLLIEIGCEELPARMIATAAGDLGALLVALLERSQIAHGEHRAWGGPRRLAVRIEAVAAGQDDRDELLLGPPAAAAFGPDGSPTPAARGFAAKHGVEPGALGTFPTPKGSRVGLRRVVAGRPLAAVLADSLPGEVEAMRFPKTMRWAEGRRRWVRPVHWVLALHGDRVIPLELLGIRSGNRSAGHRFLGARRVAIEHPDRYQAVLAEQHVVAEPDRRRSLLAAALAAAAGAAGGALVDDPALLDEVADLVEWPGVVTGRFDAAFLDLPRELLVTTLRHHQKSFSVQDDGGELLPVFLAATNTDGDPAGHVRRGNEWVVVGRLEDARFFWNEDRKTRLAERLPRLAGVIFHERSGSYADKVARGAGLARALAHELGLDEKAAERCERAARLAKADLVTSLVGEFPELQGIVGGLLLRAEGEDPEVARAVYEHYRPAGPGEAVPGSDVAGVVAAADKLDAVGELLRVGERPTGSRDPLGLRRAANGVLRIVVERGWPLSLAGLGRLAGGAPTTDLLRERLVAFLREAGFSPNEIRAVLRPRVRPEEVDAWPLPEVVARVRAIRAVRERDDFRHLVKLTERVDNILTKNAARFADVADAAATGDHRERDTAAIDLSRRVERLAPVVAGHARDQRYGEIVEALAGLIEPVDRFFADVLVLDPGDPAATRHRGELLVRLRAVLTDCFDIRELAGQAERRGE